MSSPDAERKCESVRSWPSVPGAEGDDVRSYNRVPSRVDMALGDLLDGRIRWPRQKRGGGSMSTDRGNATRVTFSKGMLSNWVASLPDRQGSSSNEERVLGTEAPVSE